MRPCPWKKLQTTWIDGPTRAPINSRTRAGGVGKKAGPRFFLECRAGGIIRQMIMARHCEKCGAEIPEGSPVCRSCFEPVKREGLLTRLLRFLCVRLSTEKSAGGATRVTLTTRTREQFKVRDAQTGELRVYETLEEVPLEYRERLQQAWQAAMSGKNVAPIVVRDASGKEQIYHSPGEMPPELRALYEKALGKGL